MKLTGILLMLLVSISGFAQQVKSLAFKEEIFDFGTVSEQGGPVSHEFVFTNMSGRPVKILSVQASCGCTTPGWSKEPVAPSKTGFVQASFNPQGRPGHFDKTLTVTTDLESNQIVLRIKGQVEAPAKAQPVAAAVSTGNYDVAKGNLKFRSSIFNMDKVFIRDEFVVKEFPFVNDGAKAIVVTAKPVSPAYIKVEVIPSTIPAGEKGKIRIGYNGKMLNQYGYHSDHIEITTDDELEPVKSFSVGATVEDYFPQQSPEEIAKGPRLIVSNSIDFGRIKPNAETVREIQFTNAGKKELTIKAVQGNCNCLSAAASKNTLKPGETSSIRVSFNPQDRSGSAKKLLTIYSNDPQGPVQRVELNAYIEN